MGMKRQKNWQAEGGGKRPWSGGRGCRGRPNLSSKAASTPCSVAGKEAAKEETALKSHVRRGLASVLQRCEHRDDARPLAEAQHCVEGALLAKNLRAPSLDINASALFCEHRRRVGEKM